MTDNDKHLDEAKILVKRFDAELEPERLREAAMALENVMLVQERDPKARARLRTNCLTAWLNLVQLLDRHIDPSFDPQDVPTKLVQPPPTSGGVVYPPGADPAVIDDPKARAEYEKAIADNRAKANHRRLQIYFGRLNEAIPPRALAFIRNSYTSSRRDQEELRTVIDKVITDPRRKADLLKLLTPPQS